MFFLVRCIIQIFFFPLYAQTRVQCFDCTRVCAWKEIEITFKRVTSPLLLVLLVVVVLFYWTRRRRVENLMRWTCKGGSWNRRVSAFLRSFIRTDRLHSRSSRMRASSAAAAMILLLIQGAAPICTGDQHTHFTTYLSLILNYFRKNWYM